MKMTDSFYQEYLEELQALETFRSLRGSLHGDVPFQNDDPYTKYIVESLAFFLAHARSQGTLQMTRLHQKLFREFFVYLVSPMPTFGILQFKPSTRLPEKMVLQKGAEFFVNAPHFKATFQILNELTIFPLFQKNFRFDRKHTKEAKCLIQYDYLHSTNENIGKFKLYVNHLNHFVSSLRVFFAFAKSLKGVSVIYDASEQIHQCKVSFGHNAKDSSLFCHEIETLRSLLHFPQQELFITLEIPPAEKRWQTITFCFDFDQEWPENISIHSDTLVPFAVPIANIKRNFAEPVLADGTKESYPLLYPNVNQTFQLHTVLSVAKVHSKGMNPLMPGLFGLGGESYDIDYFNQELSLDMPNAFENPQVISIEALWTQSQFAEYIHDKLNIVFSEAQGAGLDVSLLGPLHKYESNIKHDPNFLIQILALKNQSQLNLQELMFIVQLMKNLNNSFFEWVPDAIKECKIHQQKGENVQAILQYEFFLTDKAKRKEEMIVLFFFYLSRLLNSWLSNVDVNLKIHVPQHKKVLLIKKGHGYEISALARNFLLS